MRTRRELLTIGGAGVAALALPSFLPTRIGAGNVALAQGGDPIVAELTAQFQRIVAGLSSNPPRGNARQIAALYRMASAWARAKEIDAQLRFDIDAAIAVEGHQAFITRIAAVDFKEKQKALGIGLPPSTLTIDPAKVAKAIGALKGGLTIERALRITARYFEKYAVQFDRQIAIANGRRPGNDLVIRRVQDSGECTGDPCPGWDEQPPADGCTYNGDGTMTCTFSATQPSPTAPNGLPWPTAQECSNIEFALAMAQVMIGVYWFLMPEMWFLWAIGEAGYEYVKWYFGC